MSTLGFGLPRARTLHPDKIIALKKLTASQKPQARSKPQPKRRYTRPAPEGAGTSLVANLAYRLHEARGR